MTMQGSPNPTLSRRPNTSPTERVTQRPSVTPLVDVYENDDELLLIADVPGATKEGVRIDLDKGQLTIEAVRADDEPGTVIAAEHRPCDYFRVFTVPQGIDATKIDAQLSAGVLRLRLPKAESVKPRRIQVKAGLGKDW